MRLIDIKNELNKNIDKKYKDFQKSLIPSVDENKILGVRTPILRNLAKDIEKEGYVYEFIKKLPHKYFDENQLHAFILSNMKDYDICIKEVNRFLPYIDNWATCDQLSPKCFKKHKKELLLEIKKWIKTKHTYIIRFGIGMLMSLFLDEDFDEKYLKMVSNIKSKEYYVNMMIAWYFATALAKQYKKTIPYIEKKILDPWTHNKTINKAIESYRIGNKEKEYLKSLKCNTKD